MLLLRNLAPWLLLAFLGLQVSSCVGARNKTRGTERTMVAGAGGRAQRSGDKGASRGKFSLKDKTLCTWGAKDVGDKVKLSCKCENAEARVKGGVTEMKCDYIAKPQSCPGYQSNPQGFWKQVSRALKRLQGKICQDERALVRTAMCKRAPKHAHFKLDMASAVKSAQSGEPEPGTPPPPPPRSNTTEHAGCTKRADHRKTAEEYCSSSWASVCSFLFSMVQSEDC